MPAPPPRFDESRRDVYLRLLREGRGRHQAAREVGVDPGTVVRYRAADAAFDEEATRAEEEAAEPVQAKLYEAALDGQPWAVKLWLGRRAQGRAGGASWAEESRSVDVRVSGEVEHRVELGPAAARVAELRARLEERQAALALGAGTASGVDAADPLSVGVPAGVVDLEEVAPGVFGAAAGEGA